MRKKNYMRRGVLLAVRDAVEARPGFKFRVCSPELETQTGWTLHPGLVCRGTVDGRHFCSGHPQINRELSPVVNRIHDAHPEDIGLTHVRRLFRTRKKLNLLVEHRGGRPPYLVDPVLMALLVGGDDFSEGGRRLRRIL